MRAAEKSRHRYFNNYKILFCFFVFALCRRKSKQALRDYKKVLLQLETLEINVGDQCRKEFTGTQTRQTFLVQMSQTPLTVDLSLVFFTKMLELKHLMSPLCFSFGLLLVLQT